MKTRKKKRASRGNIDTTSAHQDHRSPEYFLELVRQVHPIAFDPATNVHNNTRAAVYATRRGIYVGSKNGVKHSAGSGLSADWRACLALGRTIVGRRGGLYINPEYGDRFKLWIGKLLDICHMRGFKGIAVVVARPETKQFRLLWRHARMCLFWGSPTLGSRIRFERPGQKHGAKFPSAVFYFGNDVKRFCEVFGPHGLLIDTAAGRLPTLGALRTQPTAVSASRSVAANGRQTRSTPRVVLAA